MLFKILDKFRTQGLYGVAAATLRRFHHRPPTVHPVSVALDAIMNNSDFTIIQLGAFTGSTSNDPLYTAMTRSTQQSHGKLLLVEPVKCFFDQLARNYEGVPGCCFENVAISDHIGPATFYRLGVDPVDHGYPEWLRQLGSLKADRLGSLWDNYEAKAQGNIDGLKEFIRRFRIEEQVDCITFHELTRRHHISQIDLLQIDVEGYEFEILKTIDFGRCPIRFINYENVLLQESKRDAERLMTKNGYKLVDFGQDTFCFRLDDNYLSKLWS